MADNSLNILLIDDDELLLRALSRTLRRLYKEATVSCLQFPEEFINCIESNGTPDVIFCDSMMPILCGAQVLERAKEVCPAAIRCLLSGDLNDNYKWQINNTIHFHLVKPFTQTHLTEVLDSAVILQGLPITSSTRAILGQLSDLPYLSTVAHSMLKELQNNEPNFEVLAKQISHDPIMSGKVLQVANSAFIGFNNHTTDFRQAIIRIGLNGLKAIVVCCELSQQLLNSTGQEALNQLVNKAFQKANMAQLLAKMLHQDTQTQLLSFAVALLSGVGELTYFCVVQDSKDKSRVSKYTLTAYLLALWGFEEAIVRAQLIDELPAEQEISLTLIHRVVDQVYSKQAFDLNKAEYDLLDELGLLQIAQNWFFEWQKTHKEAL
ncbi:HDOD domain-containing protein [Pseudoalteromonas aurantia]|uniref:Response regulator n=1 Tax=Pseudoalteromonas aurantia 208 TaxID=1314867 RepID=A0ABR9ELY5_9GAMM|nr:HDOD domain-containing protein [Pseudoalteromonas aurantia]MBE0370728.1 hypothetical protein [Pseudoalteromonas aurantia 208]